MQLKYAYTILLSENDIYSVRYESFEYSISLKKEEDKFKINVKENSWFPLLFFIRIWFYYMINLTLSCLMNYSTTNVSK